MNNEKRNRSLVISLLVLLCATGGTYFLLNTESKPEINPALFKVEDLKSIDHILLETKTKKTALSYNGTRWLVNDDHPADPRMIELIFATLLQAEPKRPVPSAKKDSLRSVIEQKGVKVSLISKGEIQKTFYAGGNISKTQSYFLEPASKEIYVMAIPGYRVYVSGIFEMPERGFRDKYVFNINWKNFRNLKAEFPEHPRENFTLSLKKNVVAIDGIEKADTAKLNTFLDQVSLLTIDQYADSAQFDHENKTMMRITIEDIADRKYQLTLFSPARPGKVEGLINGEPVYFQSAVIQPILRPRSFFAKQ
jgi:hypothetical protein